MKLTLLTYSPIELKTKLNYSIFIPNSLMSFRLYIIYIYIYSYSILLGFVYPYIRAKTPAQLITPVSPYVFVTPGYKLAFFAIRLRARSNTNQYHLHTAVSTYLVDLDIRAYGPRRD